MTLHDLKMPQLGQSVFEGTVLAWLKKPGDVVALDESVVVIQTDKAESELPSPLAGTLAEIVVAAGSTVEVGTVLARLDSAAAAVSRGAAPSAGAVAATPNPAAGAASPASPRGVGSPRVVSVGPREARQGATAVDTLAQHAPGAGFLSPAVRKLARERGVSTEQVLSLDGSGRGGRVTHRDLASWASGTPSVAAPAPTPAPTAAPAPTTSPATEDGVEIIPLTGMRLKIAEHMLAATRNIPHVNTVAEADMSAIDAARRAHGPAFQERHGFGLSWNAFLLRACAEALAEFPLVNAVLDERGIVTHRSVHLGMAVALEPSGLVVPVIRNAHELTVREIALEAKRLSDLARSRKLTADDMSGGTCTMTNPGVFGNTFGTPIIHAPQAAIIDFGAIKKRVVVVGDDTIAIRPTCHVVLAWDHRVMDGATAARFLQRLVLALEHFPTASID